MFYKEWIKTRWIILLFALVNFGFSLYVVLNLRRVILLKGAAHLWEVALTRDAIFITLMKFLPLITGLLFAIFQFLPEMAQKRLKLTLHLPQNHFRSVFQMLIFGLGVLTTIFALDFIFLACAVRFYFAFEIFSQIMLTALPWFFAGLLGFLLCAWCCLELSWLRRVIYAALSSWALWLFFFDNSPQAYNNFLPFMILGIIFAISLPMLSVDRFKKGKE